MKNFACSLLALIVLSSLGCRKASEPSQMKSPTPSKVSPSDAVSAVEEYCREVARFTDASEATKLTFGRTCSTPPENRFAPLECSWKQFASESQWQSRIDVDGNDNYGAAFVWIRNGRIVQANFTFQTPSYDWANLANYCFRPNGSIASVTTTLNDLNLDVSVHRVALYSDNGERSQITEEARVLSTKKRTNVPDEIVQAEKGDSSNSGFNTPMYRSIDDLPFAKLLAR